MSVSWDYYRRRNKIMDLKAWCEQKEIYLYSDFLKVLRSLGLESVPPTHPDLVLMGITKGQNLRDEARSQPNTDLDQDPPFKSLEEAFTKSKLEHVTNDEVHALRKEPDSLSSIDSKASFTKSKLQQMKKAELQRLCDETGVKLKAGKQTKSSLVSALMSSQKQS